MYEIQKITKKRNSNYNLYLDGYKEEKIEIHLDILYSYKLYSRREIDEKEFELMMIENEKKLAKKEAFRIVSTSIKTRKEMVEKLKRKRYSDEAVNYAMKFIDDYEFINEDEIAEKLVEGKFTRKKYSKRMMSNKLRQKGIDQSIIDEKIQDIDQDDEYENAMHYAKKKYKSLEGKEKDVIKRKIGSSLTYRGFDYATINRVIENLIKDSDFDY